MATRLAFVRDGIPADDCIIFPARLVEAMHEGGLLLAPVSRALGGEGVGIEAASAGGAMALLRALGRLWLPLARVYEGHVNALRLIARYGDADQSRRAAGDAAVGHLFAIWAAENPGDPVRLSDARLSGQKMFASAAGSATRALVTVATEAGERLVVAAIPPGQDRIVSRPAVHGMLGAGTAQIDLTGIVVPAEAVIGHVGDYMRQPEISLGAWRPLAALSGGLQALVEAVRGDLQRRGRAAAPLQAARYAELLVTEETARMWAERAGWLAETQGDEDAAAYVKLARLAVDAACARAIELAQRAVGLAGFVRPHPVERLCRDLATYMRQPALDEVALEAATYHLRMA